MVRDRETAEDLAQDTFIKVLNHIDKYSPSSSSRAGCSRSPTTSPSTTCAAGSLDTVSVDGSPHALTAAEVEATSFDLTSRGETALEELESRELGTAIERAIARLRPEYRSCILLRHVEGRSYEEIAATLDLPLGTVKTYIHRARHELRRELAHLKT
jgi:RNA polymerase sigma-70 factor (ECF subfamily)